MKNLFLLFVLSLAYPPFSFSQVYLSEAISVPPDNTFGYRAPRLILTASDEPLVYWGKSNTSTLYVSRMSADTFSSPAAISTGTVDPSLFGGGLGPQLVSFGDTIYLAMEEYGEGLYCLRSTDGGYSFSLPVVVYEPPVGRVATLPSIAVDPAGQPIVSFVTTNNNEEEALYEVAKSTDYGSSFAPPVVANTPAAGNEVCECCPANLSIRAADDFLLVFRNNNNNIRDIWAARSIDGGAIFGQATDLDNTDWQTFSCPQSGPTGYRANDSLYVAFYSGANGNHSVYLSSLHIPSMLKGGQIDLPRADGGTGSQNFPRMAGNGDTLGIIWQEANISSGWDLSFAWSVNGSTDLARQVIRIDSSSGHQRYPDIAFANGVFHLVYEDGSQTNVLYRQISFEPLTSLRPIEPPNHLAPSLWPNPSAAKTLLRFRNPSSAAVEISLFNNSGQLVTSYTNHSQQQLIQTSGLAKGVYIIRLRLEGQMTSLKMVVGK